MTQHILVSNINSYNSVTCFGSLSHHQAKTIVLVHSVSEVINIKLKIR